MYLYLYPTTTKNNSSLFGAVNKKNCQLIIFKDTGYSKLKKEGKNKDMIVTLSFYKYSKFCFTFMLLSNIAWK